MASWEAPQTPLLASAQGKEFLRTCQVGRPLCLSLSCLLSNVCTCMKTTKSEVSHLHGWGIGQQEDRRRF